MIYEVGDYIEFEHDGESGGGEIKRIYRIYDKAQILGVHLQYSKGIDKAMLHALGGRLSSYEGWWVSAEWVTKHIPRFPNLTMEEML